MFPPVIMGLGPGMDRCNLLLGASPTALIKAVNP
jgi:hypothetical protein